MLSFVNDLERPVGTYLYGRRMYETMLYWEAPPLEASRSPFAQDFSEIWQKADKIVYSLEPCRRRRAPGLESSAASSPKRCAGSRRVPGPT